MLRRSLQNPNYREADGFVQKAALSNRSRDSATAQVSSNFKTCDIEVQASCSRDGSWLLQGW